LANTGSEIFLEGLLLEILGVSSKEFGIIPFSGQLGHAPGGFKIVVTSATFPGPTFTEENSPISKLLATPLWVCANLNPHPHKKSALFVWIPCANADLNLHQLCGNFPCNS
jgi:hypothetical protein